MMWFLLFFNGVLGFVLGAILGDFLPQTSIFNDSTYAYWFFALFIAIAFGVARFMVSKGGEWLLRLIAPARKMSQREKEKVKHALHLVQEKAKEKFNFEINDLHLFTIDSPLINAFAMSRNILAVTRGALDTLDTEDLAGLIAHEHGHFYYKDSEKLAINLGLLVMAEGLLYVNAILMLLKSKLSQIHGLVAMVMLIPFVLALMFKYVGSIGIWVYNITYPMLSRKQEYRADMFACELGFGKGMLTVLETIQGYEYKENNFSSKVTQTHPDTALRIDEIDKYLAAA